jgi:capsid protein
MDRVHGEFMQAALAFGQIALPNGSTLPLSKIDKFSQRSWQGRRWEWVDPRADIDADITAINAGLKSPQSVATKLGLDYEDLLIEIKAAQDMREAIGVNVVGLLSPQQLAAAAGAATIVRPRCRIRVSADRAAGSVRADHGRVDVLRVLGVEAAIRACGAFCDGG